MNRFSPPAEMRQAVRPIATLIAYCQNGFTSTCAQADIWLENHEELKSRYKEKWATWEEACQAVYGISKQAVHKKLLRYSERLSSEEAVRSESINKTVSPCTGQKQRSTAVDQSLDIGTQNQSKYVPPIAPTKPDPASNGAPSKASAPNADQWEKKEQYAATNTEVPRDASGCVIPQHLLPLMARAKEVTEMMHHAAKLRSLFEGLQSAQDKLFRSLCRTGNVQTFMTSASSMHYALSHCLPQIVCPVCQGSGQKEHTEHQNGEKVPWCWECAGTGMVSQVHWHREWEKSIDLRKQAEVARRSA